MSKPHRVSRWDLKPISMIMTVPLSPTKPQHVQTSATTLTTSSLSASCDIVNQPPMVARTRLADAVHNDGDNSKIRQHPAQVMPVLDKNHIQQGFAAIRKRNNVLREHRTTVKKLKTKHERELDASASALNPDRQVETERHELAMSAIDAQSDSAKVPFLISQSEELKAVAIPDRNAKTPAGSFRILQLQKLLQHNPGKWCAVDAIKDEKTADLVAPWTPPNSEKWTIQQHVIPITVIARSKQALRSGYQRTLHDGYQGVWKMDFADRVPPPELIREFDHKLRDKCLKAGGCIDYNAMYRHVNMELFKFEDAMHTTQTKAEEAELEQTWLEKVKYTGLADTDWDDPKFAEGTCTLPIM